MPYNHPMFDGLMMLTILGLGVLAVLVADLISGIAKSTVRGVRNAVATYRKGKRYDEEKAAVDKRREEILRDCVAVDVLDDCFAPATPYGSSVGLPYGLKIRVRNPDGTERSIPYGTTVEAGTVLLGITR